MSGDHTAASPPPRRPDGYAPIESYAVLGDGRTSALVAPDGAIDWWTHPTMAAPPILDALLDTTIGGAFVLQPAVPFTFAGRRYLDDSAVLETTYSVGAATVRVTDALNRGTLGLLPWSELARRVEVDGGPVPMRWSFRPGQRFSHEQPAARWHGTTPLLGHGDQLLAVLTDRAGEPQLQTDSVNGEFVAEPGTRALVAIVGTDAEPLHLPKPQSIQGRLDDTLRQWERWADDLEYDGPWRDHVVRSAVALRVLTFQPSGAILAAATTSLPEALDADRNYDYRYAWVRDASFSLDTLMRLALPEEVHGSMSWLLGTVARTAPDVEVFYAIDGSDPGDEERPVSGLQGWRGATPVKVGNRAASQRQLGAFGDLLDAAWRYADRGNVLNPATGNMLASIADRTVEQWSEDDAGIWELPEYRHYTISKIACWVALDRAIRLAEAGQLPADRVDRWREQARAIREYVDTACWSADKGSYTAYAGADDLDCAVLLAARTGFSDKGDERLAGTIDAIRAELSAGGPLLYRYTGMRGKEGAFVACSFWLVEAMIHVGRIEQATELFESMVTRCNDVGLLSEEIDPETGEFRGNVPQALSHLALIGAATALGDVLRGREAALS